MQYHISVAVVIFYLKRHYQLLQMLQMWHVLLALRAILFENIYVLVEANSDIHVVLAEP